jgi:hypothetical protein
MVLTRVLAASLLGVVGVSVASAGSASAATKLYLKANGAVAAAGSGAWDRVSISIPVSQEGRGVGGSAEKCILESWGGELETNGMAKDSLAFPSATFRFCKNETGPGFSISGGEGNHVKVASSGAGQIRFATRLAVNEPGPCVYEYAKVAVTYSYPGVTASSASAAEGKLNKKASARTCTPTQTNQVELGLFYEESPGSEILYQTEVRG